MFGCAIQQRAGRSPTSWMTLTVASLGSARQHGSALQTRSTKVNAVAVGFPIWKLRGLPSLFSLHVDKCIPQDERIASNHSTFYLFNPQHGQPLAVFGRRMYISGRWMLLCKEPIVAEDSPHIHNIFILHFNIALVFLVASVCCDTAQRRRKRWMILMLLQTAVRRDSFPVTLAEVHGESLDTVSHLHTWQRSIQIRTSSYTPSGMSYRQTWRW